jgi:hemerythrin-like domain-containing protein
LIEKRTKRKKGIIAYNTSFGINSMKQHVEVEHLELFDAYATKFVGVENNLGS